jgi:hypothetical protein
MTEGLRRIIRERLSQIDQGYDREHDRQEHAPGQLALAALTALLAYLERQEGVDVSVAGDGPEGPTWMRELAQTVREDPKRGLEIAGALLAAEMDREADVPEREVSDLGDLTVVAKDVEQTFDAYGFADVAFAMVFTVPADRRQAHWVTNVSRRDGMQMLSGALRRMQAQMN